MPAIHNSVGTAAAATAAGNYSQMLNGSVNAQHTINSSSRPTSVRSTASAASSAANGWGLGGSVHTRERRGANMSNGHAGGSSGTHHHSHHSHHKHRPKEAYLGRGNQFVYDRQINQWVLMGVQERRNGGNGNDDGSGSESEEDPEEQRLVAAIQAAQYQRYMEKQKRLEVIGALGSLMSSCILARMPGRGCTQCLAVFSAGLIRDILSLDP